MNRSFKILISVLTIISLAIFTSSCSKDIIVSTNTNATQYRDTTINGEPAIVIKDLGNGISGTLTNNRIWILDGMVYINSGQSVIIQEGTIIKGLTGSNNNASALVVAKGGVLIADGTAQKPIIFTSIQDGLTMAEVGNGDFVGTLTANDNQLWGGLIILGDADINISSASVQLTAIASDTRNTFGGSDDNDYSGVLNYVSIRHTGAIENLAGLTLAGVGRNTAIEKVEVIATKYNGIDFIGGNARTKFVLSALANQNSVYCRDGYSGLNQFWLTLPTAQTQRVILVDGTTTNNFRTPHTVPVFANATFKGNNSNTIATTQNNGGFKLYNSIIYNFINPMSFEFDENLINSTYIRYKAGDITYNDNIWFNIINATTDTSNFIVTAFGDNVANIDTLNQFKVELKNTFDTNGNTVEDPMLTNEVPQAASSANTAPELNSINTFFDALATYKGAFKTGEDKWTKDWTLASQLGILPD